MKQVEEKYNRNETEVKWNIIEIKEILKKETVEEDKRNDSYSKKRNWREDEKRRNEKEGKIKGMQIL
jgi:hypothetical protein